MARNEQRRTALLLTASERACQDRVTDRAPIQRARFSVVCFCSFRGKSVRPMVRQLPWYRDPMALARMDRVQAIWASGDRNHCSIAAKVGVTEATIRNDLKRLRELWLERIGDNAEVLRSEAAIELDDVKRRALAAAEWDQRCEEAVLTGTPVIIRDCEGDGLHDIGWDEEAGRRIYCDEPHQVEVRVYRDAKGSAQFRGQKAQSLNVARQAVMDKARLLGVVIEPGDVIPQLPPARVVILEQRPPRLEVGSQSA